jgi:hypothetical protein
MGARCPAALSLLSEPAARLWAEVVARAPSVASALGVLLALWLVARVARSLTPRLLCQTRHDECSSVSDCSGATSCEPFVDVGNWQCFSIS